MILNKPYTTEQYAELSIYCNNNEMKIVDKGEYLESVPQYTPEEKEQMEKERIARLFLTGADVERGIYKAKGLDFDDVLEMVKEQQPTQYKAVKIELKANNFYRGNPYVSQLGAMLGLKEKQLDEFFETNDWTVLVAKPTTEKEEQHND